MGFVSGFEIRISNFVAWERHFAASSNSYSSVCSIIFPGAGCAGAGCEALGAADGVGALGLGAGFTGAAAAFLGSGAVWVEDVAAALAGTFPI